MAGGIRTHADCVSQCRLYCIPAPFILAPSLAVLGRSLAPPFYLTVAISRAKRRLHSVVRRHSFVTSMFYTAEIGALANDSQLCMFIVPFYPQRRQVFISQLILNLVIYKLVLEVDCLDIYTIIINKLSK